uniref:hypothetical protein n=1 Tax=Amycolatopsis sp. CA-096443 TaxID=3239919 RepID=UPI003F496109
MVQLLVRPATASEPVAVQATGSAPTGTRNPLDTMQFHLDHCRAAKRSELPTGARPVLMAVPCDVDCNWIIDWLLALARVPGLRQIRTGDCRGYDRLPAYVLEDGHDLDPASLALGRPQLVEEAFAAWEQLVGDAIPEKLQVSIPNVLDLAYFISGSAETAPRWLPTVQAMLAAEVREIAQRWGDRVRLQLESPAVMLSYFQTPREGWPQLTEQLVDQVAALISVAPDADWVLHTVCYGDLEHQPLFVPTDLDAAVMFLNALARRLEEMGIAMPIAHIPVTYADAAPPTDPAFYEILRQLRGDIQVIAGVTAEHHPEATAVAASLMAEVLGARLKAVGAACGLGRRTPEDAVANHRLSVRIAAFLSTLVHLQAA